MGRLDVPTDNERVTVRRDYCSLGGRIAARALRQERNAGVARYRCKLVPDPGDLRDIFIACEGQIGCHRCSFGIRDNRPRALAVTASGNNLDSSRPQTCPIDRRESAPSSSRQASIFVTGRNAMSLRTFRKPSWKSTIPGCASSQRHGAAISRRHSRPALPWRCPSSAKQLHASTLSLSDRPTNSYPRAKPTQAIRGRLAGGSGIAGHRPVLCARHRRDLLQRGDEPPLELQDELFGQAGTTESEEAVLESAGPNVPVDVGANF